MKLAVSLIAFLLGGWLVFDGSHALVSGDYVTARSGDHAGELGPWAKVVSAIGVDPRSTGMKCAHLLLGVLWLTSLLVFLVQPAAGRLALAGCSCLSLWYLPLGTLLGLVELWLLLTPALRNLR